MTIISEYIAPSHQISQQVADSFAELLSAKLSAKLHAKILQGRSITHEIDEITTLRKEAALFAASLIKNNSIVSSDNKASIENKIANLKSLKTYALTHIDIDTLPDDALQLKFIKLIAQLNEQIEEFEIHVGKFSRADLTRIGKRFSRKTEYPIGLVD